jgi:hypothetical protein
LGAGLAAFLAAGLAAFLAGLAAAFFTGFDAFLTGFLETAFLATFFVAMDR